MSQRKMRRKRGTPVVHLDMVPPDATPEQAHKIRMRQRAERRDERSHRIQLFKQNAEQVERPAPTTTDVAKTKAAAEKRERRRQRNLVNLWSDQQGRAESRRDMLNGFVFRSNGDIEPFRSNGDIEPFRSNGDIEPLDWTKKGLGR